MLGRMRSEPWKRLGAWFRAIGLVLLLAGFFLPGPTAAVLAVTVAGATLFLIGALVWLARDAAPWRR